MSTYCPGCGAGSFRLAALRVDEGSESVLACSECGRVVGTSYVTRLGELEREIRLLREELARLRQAVNFLNQRVR